MALHATSSFAKGGVSPAESPYLLSSGHTRSNIRQPRPSQSCNTVTVHLKRMNYNGPLFYTNLLSII